MGDEPNQRGNSGAGSWPRSRTRCAACRPTHRPLPDPPARPRHRHRGNAFGAVRPDPQPARSARSGPLRCPPRTSSRPSGSPSGAAWNASAPSNRPTRSSTAASSPRCCPSPSATAWARWCGARSRRAAHRPIRKGQQTDLRRADMLHAASATSPAGRRRAAHPGRRAGGTAADAPRDGVCDRPSRRDQRAHRPAHHGATRRPARRNRRHARATTSSTGSTRSSRPAPTSACPTSPPTCPRSSSAQTSAAVPPRSAPPPDRIPLRSRTAGAFAAPPALLNPGTERSQREVSIAVAQTFTPGNGRTALNISEGGHARGKLLLLPAVPTPPASRSRHAASLRLAEQRDHPLTRNQPQRPVCRGQLFSPGDLPHGPTLHRGTARTHAI